jgi:uncharacterized membrane protein YcaP (DUF421 family)
MHSLAQWFSELLGLGLNSSTLDPLQTAARAVVVFLCSLILVRIADRRFLGRSAGLDIVLAIIFGSVMSRAINGSAPLGSTLSAGLMLAVLHRVLAFIACRSHLLSVILKGRDRLLVRDGQIDHAQLRRADFSADDLLENLRLRGNVGQPQDVAEARLERNGQISVVRRRR